MNEKKKKPVKAEESVKKTNEKNAGFFKRFAAYMLDLIIVSLVASFIYTGVNMVAKFDTSKTEAHNKAQEQLLDDYNNEKISTEEYTSKFYDLSEASYRDVTLEAIPYSLVELVILILYMIVYAFYNKGQTIGKKLFNIRIVGENNKAPEMNKILIRSVINCSMYVTVLEMILVFFVKKDFFAVSLVIEGIAMCILLISAIMIIFNDDKRGIHDKIAKTKVISEI